MVNIVHNYRCDICGYPKSAGRKNVFNHAKCSKKRQKVYLAGRGHGKTSLQIICLIFSPEFLIWRKI